MRQSLAGVLTYFNATLETILLEMEAEYSVTIERLKYMNTKAYAGNQFPYMSILADSGNNEYSDEETPTEDLWKIRNVRIITVHNNSDINVVQDTLLYYDDAINRLIINDNTFGALFNRVRLLDEDFSEMGQWVTSPKNYEQSMLIILEIRKLLSY